MNKIEFRMQDSDARNDHQVRILVDGDDFIQTFDEDALGIDPHWFFNQEALKSPGRLMVARCECGCHGCSDTFARVRYDSDCVIWDSLPEGPLGTTLVFSKRQYEEAIQEARNDHSWETIERTAERRIAEEVDVTPLLDYGLDFFWASGRISPTDIVLCFFADDCQVLVPVPWNHVNVDEVVASVKKYLETPPQEWVGVECYRQKNTVEHLPSCSGSGWKKGSKGWKE